MALAAALEFARPINHDVAWILTVADLMHAGRHLYTDIIEINPPLIFWAASGMRAIASLLHIAPETVYRVAVLLLGLVSAESISRLTGQIAPALALLVGGLILVGHDFGQRDVLTAFLVTPYVALAATRRGDVRSAWLIGVAAGLGFCLKPYYLGIWLLMMLYRRRWLRIDWIIFATGIAYVITVPILAPGFAPLVRDLSSGYSRWLAIPWLYRLVSVPTLLGLIVLLFSLLLVRRRVASSAVLPIALAATGSLLAFWVQGKPFTYHQQPLLIFGLVALAACAVPWRWSVALPACVAALLVLARWSTLDRQGRAGMAERWAVERALASIPAEGETVFLSEFLFHGPPIFRHSERPWELAAPSIWWVGPPDDLLSMASRHSVMRRVAASVANARVVIVDPVTRGSPSVTPPFLQVLREDPDLGPVLSDQFTSPMADGPFQVLRRLPHADTPKPTE